MDKKSYDFVKESIAIIETVLEKKTSVQNQMNVQELAGMSFLSKNHYQRLFQSITGESVMDYIKKRRFSIARRELRETDTSILDIALNLGYLSHEGFTRAFKAYFGMSPAAYRKNWKVSKGDYFMEGFTMKNISTQKLIDNAEATAKAIDTFVNEANSFINTAQKMADDEGQNAMGVQVLLRELRHLLSRAAGTRDVARSFAKEKISLFERAEKIFGIIKALDDLTFQMNILALHSGIEVARMGRELFNQVQKGFADLAMGMFQKNKGVGNLIDDLILIISEDIKANAGEILNDIIDTLKQAAEAGEEAAGFTEKTANEMNDYGKGYGNGFMSVANEINCQIEEIKLTRKKIEAGNYQEELFGQNSVAFIKRLRKIIKRTSEIAFFMNVLAFNAEIEAARAGGRGNTNACAEMLLKYAGRLQEVQSICIDHTEEIVLLPELFTKIKNAKYGEELDTMTKVQFAFSDVGFQGKMFAIQLRMEAERSNRDVFRDIAKQAEESLAVLSDIDFDSDIEIYKKVLEKFYALTDEVGIRCRDDGEAQGNHGCCFRFMANEYYNFLGRLNGFMSELKKIE